jgi:hypothetical protein
MATSAFTLAKCVRDQHEANTVVHRIDEARLEKFLAEHDPFNPKIKYRSHLSDRKNPGNGAGVLSRSGAYSRPCSRA